MGGQQLFILPQVTSELGMIEFFLPNSRARLPTFSTICPDGSYCAQMGSHFAQNTTTNPCSFLSSHKPLSEICMNKKHPQPHPAPPKNTSFLGLILKVGKMNNCLRKVDPIWAKCLKSGQNCSRSAQLFFIHEHGTHSQVRRKGSI